MFNLQGSEIIIILLLALVVLGPDKLPDAVRRFSQTYSELKKMGSGFQTELKSALDEPMREMRETAQVVRDAVDPSKITAEAEAERRLRDEAAWSNPAEPTSVDPASVDPASEDSAAEEQTEELTGGTKDAPQDAQSFEGVADPGSDLVATPGDAPDDQRTSDDMALDESDESKSS